MQEVDCLVVGGGFAGVHALYRLRQEGFSVKLVESASGLGGTCWRHAHYPGARVDTPAPLYALSFPPVWRTWNWSQTFPDAKELRRYFDHVERVLDLSRDCIFNSQVTSAVWNDKTSRWQVAAGKDVRIRCRYLYLCVGAVGRILWPDIPNRDAFRGPLYHSGAWPEGLEPEDLAGKRVAVVGTGASGVQIVQELGAHVKHLTSFVRTPNLALPMKNPPLSIEEQDSGRDGYAELYATRSKAFSGTFPDVYKQDWRKHSSEEREHFYEDLWEKAGFHFWQGTYVQGFLDKECNDTMYEFWQRKVAPTITDPKKRAILAPEQAPHPFGILRPSLQTHYYQVVSQDNVELISLKDRSIKTFTETGLELSDGTKRDFDVIILATGYDTHTGSFKNMDIRGKDGVRLSEYWQNGAKTLFGLATSNMPNCFFTYGPQAPTANANGPTSAEVQVEWTIDLLKYARRQGIVSITPTVEAEAAWGRAIWDVSSRTLAHSSVLGYNMGRNVKDKPIQPLNYLRGLPRYQRELNASSSAGYHGWELKRDEMEWQQSKL